MCDTVVDGGVKVRRLTGEVCTRTAVKVIQSVVIQSLSSQEAFTLIHKVLTFLNYKRVKQICTFKKIHFHVIDNSSVVQDGSFFLHRFKLTTCRGLYFRLLKKKRNVLEYGLPFVTFSISWLNL